MKTVKLWAGVNKNGWVSLHNEQPTRNEAQGKWVSKSPFCNQNVQKQFTEMMAKVKMTWEAEPEYFELNFE